MQTNNNLSQDNTFSIIVAAGGTGGHLFPAVAVIQQLEKLLNHQLLTNFVGSLNRIESRVVPQLGYGFHKINISGFTGIFTFNTLLLPYKIFRSILKCRKLINLYKPNVILCTGAYISYPLGVAAHQENIPLVLMESNVIPGKTIKMLSPKADLIVTSYSESLRYFHPEVKSKIRCLGNPVREFLYNIPSKEQALLKFGLDPAKKTVLVFGGSLGARSINSATEKAITNIDPSKVQFIWQTGSNYNKNIDIPDNVRDFQFIDDMASAYSASDIVVSRSGATSVSEICTVGKPSILVPYPNAANNEQELNGLVLAENEAAYLVYDNEIFEKMQVLIELFLKNPSQFEAIGKKAKTLAKQDAALMTAKTILEMTLK